MVFITFLASVAVLHWVVGNKPGPGKSNQSAPTPDFATENDPALATVDLVSLAQSLARECPAQPVEEKVLQNLRSPRPGNATGI
jgi:hypothetical protein